MSDGASQAYSDYCEFQEEAENKYGNLSKKELNHKTDELLKLLKNKEKNLKSLEKEVRSDRYELDLMLSLYYKRKKI